MATLLSPSRDNRILSSSQLSRKMVPVSLVFLKKHPIRPLISNFWWAAILVSVLAQIFPLTPAMGAVEFPGPVEQPLLAGPLSAIPIPWSDENAEYLLVGNDNGFLNVVYHLFQDIHFDIFVRFFLGGEIQWLGAWEGGPFGQRGFVAATSNPDRLHFLEISYSDPYIRVEQTLTLPEDPGMGEFVASGPEGQGQLALSLPGVDQVLILRESADFWTINQTLPTGDEPLFLEAIDLDGDHIPELVSANRGELSGTLGIFQLGNDGFYAQQQHAELPGRVHQVLAEDFDLDGLKELVVSYIDLPRLDVLSSESGDLAVRHSLPMTFPSDYFQIVFLPSDDWGIVSAVEKRGMMDFFHFKEEQWVYQDSYYVGCLPRRLVVGDYNGDDINEVACLGSSQNVVTILLGNTLPGFWGYPAVPLTGNPGSSTLADLNGDGLSDLIVGSLVPKGLSVYLRESTGELSIHPVLQDVEFFPLSLTAGDFMGDQSLELVVLDSGGNALYFLNYVEGVGLVTQAEVPYSSGLSKLRVADIDDDGHLDLYLTQTSRLQVDVLFGSGEGTFAPVMSIDFPLGAYDVLALDMNDDSLLELVVSDGHTRVWTVENMGARSFGSPVHTQANSGARYLAAADLDGDSDQDVVVANFTSESLSILENVGDGSFNRRVGSLGLVGQPSGVECRDMDNDGLVDMVLRLGPSNGVQVLPAWDVWQYSSIGLFETSDNVVQTLIEDFNQDDRPDILCLDSELQLGLVMLNTQRALVSVDPTALTQACDGEHFTIGIRPDRQGPWELSLGNAGQWRVLAANGQSQVGQLGFGDGQWILDFDSADVGFPDAAMELRLKVGFVGNEETLLLPLAPSCFATGNVLPGLRWRDLPWPNPFNPRIHSRIQLYAPDEIDAAVFDLAGRRVATLRRGYLEAGVHDLTWDGQYQGQSAAAGLYLLRVRSSSSLLSRKIVLLK